MVTLMDCGTNHRATLTLIHLVFFFLIFHLVMHSINFCFSSEIVKTDFHENIFLSGKNKLAA